MENLSVTNNQNLVVNRVKAFPLKNVKTDFTEVRLFMKKLKDYPLEEYSINYNYVLKQIERLESKKLTYEEKLTLNLLKCKIRNISNYHLTPFFTKALNEVFMTIVKLNTQKNCL